MGAGNTGRGIPRSRMWLKNTLGAPYRLVRLNGGPDPSQPRTLKGARKWSLEVSNRPRPRPGGGWGFPGQGVHWARGGCIFESCGQEAQVKNAPWAVER